MTLRDRHLILIPVVAAAAFLCAAMPAAAQSPEDFARRHGLLPAKPAPERRTPDPRHDRKRDRNEKEERDEREPEIAFGRVENDTVISPDGRRFRITKAKALFSELEMVEPVGAGVELFLGARRVLTNDVPFIWNNAKSTEYVKIQVTERDRVWAFKILPEQGTRLVIGKGAPARPATPVVKVKPAPRPNHKDKAKPSPEPSRVETAGYQGRYLSMERLTFRHGDAIDVVWHGTPGNSLDWITVVPAGSPPGEWGNWSYTGNVNGKHRVSGLKPGRYEARISFNSSNDIEDRVEFTITQ